MGFENYVYRNLAAEMARKGLASKDIAKILSVSQSAVNCKVTGKTSMALSEAFKIRDELFPKLTVDYLFDTRIRYDMIDVFNFPGKQVNEESIKHTRNVSDNPDDCA